MKMRKHITGAAAVLAAAAVMSCSAGSPREVRLDDYLEGAHTACDTAMAIRRAVECAVSSKGSTLVLPGGTLEISDEYAKEKFLYISNNYPSSDCAKRIAFDLSGADGLTVEGNGTLLLFSGYVIPFHVEGARNVTVRNLKVDFKRSSISEGVIADAGEGYSDLSFPHDYRIVFESGALVFMDARGNRYPYWSLLEYDPVREEIAHYVRERAVGYNGIRGEKLDNGLVRIYHPGFSAAKGNVLVFGPLERRAPGFFLESSSGITLEDVTMWQCPGMGVIAQRSENILLDRMVVEPAPGSGRLTSVGADATHFINCRGLIHLRGCSFSCQWDDCTNIHGWYSVCRERLSSNSLLLWSNYRTDFAVPGMTMELVDHNNMMPYGKAVVRGVEKLNSDLSIVTFAEDLPESLKTGDVLADADADPDVIIEGCTFVKNRARGILIGSAGKVVVRDSYFHSAGSAILFEGDGSFWFERAGVRDVTITGNSFVNCLHGSREWGKACIEVHSGIPDRESSLYHSNITVTDNLFDGFDPRILDMYCVDGLVFEGNTIRVNSDYTSDVPADAGHFVTEHCRNVRISQ